MNKKTQQNLIVACIFFAGLVFVYFQYLLGPLNIKYKDSVSKLHETQNKLNEMRQRAVELPKLQAEMKYLEIEVKGLEKLLPKEKEIPDLLRTITKTAQRYGVKILNFSPGPIVPKADYNEVPFMVTAQGNYSSFANFLAEIGQQKRLFSTRNIGFNANPVSKDNPYTISVNFSLVAYTFKG